MSKIPPELLDALLKLLQHPEFCCHCHDGSSMVRIYWQKIC
jgi:hypothetical protein